MRVSFLHRGGEQMASYRYRAKIPAQELGWSINDPSADVLIYAKPLSFELEEAKTAKRSGRRVIVDFCDDHFGRFPFYSEMALLADQVTVPTEEMGLRTRTLFQVIPDPYEFEELLPHCDGDRLLWFGHAVNFRGLQRILPELQCYPLTIISNVVGTVPWSLERMRDEFIRNDIVILPATEPYKSPNRAIEAIRQGCFVVAEPHPSLTGFPGIWIGNIKKGIEWARQNPQLANDRTATAQDFVRKRFSPRILADAWKRVIQGSSCTLEAEASIGMAG